MWNCYHIIKPGVEELVLSVDTDQGCNGDELYDEMVYHGLITDEALELYDIDGDSEYIAMMPALGSSLDDYCWRYETE